MIFGNLNSLLLELNVELTSIFDKFVKFDNFSNKESTIEKEFFAGQLGFF